MTVPEFIQKILNRFNGHMQDLLRGASIAFSLKILAAGLWIRTECCPGPLMGGRGFWYLFSSLYHRSNSCGHWQCGDGKHPSPVRCRQRCGRAAWKNIIGSL